jgi:PEP-CTERM/exosortase A-associated glycosyltransferase
MKILHILDHSLPLHSGYAFRSQNIFREQRKRGWHPVIVTSPKHEQSWKGPCDREEKIGGFTHYRSGAVNAGSSTWVQEFRLMRTLARRIEEVAILEKPDILHAHSPVLNGLPSLRVGRKLGIPVAYEIRAFWEDAAVDHNTYSKNSLKYRLVRSAESWVCRKADQIAILCEGLKKDLVQRGIPNFKMTVVYNGINPNDFACNKQDAELARAWKINGRKVIAFIGSFYRYEGLDLLVEAFSIVVERRPSVVLLLVGGGEMEEELAAQVKRLNLKKKVIMVGRVPHERIPGVYALADILAYPRYLMRLTDLVTPLKPLEAMAMGKALVASNVGGHHELIKHGETGLLFPAGNTLALAESLERLLNDDAFRDKLRLEASRWVREHHTWEKTTAVYQEMYAKALASRGTRIPRMQIDPQLKRSNKLAKGK